MTGQDLLAAIYQDEPLPYYGHWAGVMAEAACVMLDSISGSTPETRRNAQILLSTRPKYHQMLRELLAETADLVQGQWNEIMDNSDPPDGAF